MLAIGVTIRKCVVYVFVGAMPAHMFVYAFFENEFRIHRVVLAIQNSPEPFLNMLWVLCSRNCGFMYSLRENVGCWMRGVAVLVDRLANSECLVSPGLVLL